MNRQLWFRILQVAVIAPYLYKISNDKQTGTYYRFGLKAVAGSLVIMNLQPIVTGLAPIAKVLAQAAMEYKPIPLSEKESAIDGEFVEKA